MDIYCFTEKIQIGDEALFSVNGMRVIGNDVLLEEIPFWFMDIPFSRNFWIYKLYRKIRDFDRFGLDYSVEISG